MSRARRWTQWYRYAVVALFTVKPSRWSVVFFAVLLLGFVLRYAHARHEQRLIETDGPPAHTTRRLLRCVLGRDAQRLLGPRSLAAWSRTATERLQRLVTLHHSSTWPSRCVPIAERLATRLAPRPEAHTAAEHARQLALMLRNAAGDRRTAIEVIERGELGTALATVAFDVTALSDGAAENWINFLRESSTDLWPAEQVIPPHAATVADGVEYATLAMPDLVLYQSVADRRLHMVTFGPDERPRSDRAIGRGAPVRGPWREGALLVAADDGDSLFLPGGEPAQLVPLPAPLREGREAADDWHVALTPSLLWLLTADAGTLRVRTTPRSGAVHWSEPFAPIGGPDVMVGGVLLPDPSGGDAVRVIAVRRGASGVSVEQYALSAPRATSANTLATPGDTSLAPQVLLREWPAYDPWMTTCAAGRARYLLVRASDALSVVRVDGERALRRELSYSTAGTPRGRRLELGCDERGALLFVDLEMQAGALVHFDFGADEPVVLMPPRLGNRARVLGGALAPEGAVVAFIAGGTVRAFRTSDRGAHWEGGEIVAAPREIDAFELAAVGSLQNQIALLTLAHEQDRIFVGRLASRDGGRTFHGD